MEIKTIAIFASGNGSNAENIINYFSKNESLNFIIFCNNPKALVLERAKRLNIFSILFSKENFEDNSLTNILKKLGIEFIVLSGFLWKIPRNIISCYQNKIINIHPALLPKYGGKGMYGINIHNSVFKNKESETGITIHFINENYDEGEIILQKKIDISNVKSPEEIAKKVGELEYKYFPEILEKLFYD